MAIYDLWLSRNNGPTVANYVGHAGKLFYDSSERVLRISDGTTAGGEVFNGLVTVNTVEPTNNFQGQVWLNPQTFELSIYHSGNFIPTIDTATSTKLGGIKLGPGVTVNAQSQLIIDSEGLDFSFGDIASTTETYAVGHPQAGEDYAVLSTINTDEDLYLVSNGTGSVDVVGEFKVYKTDGDVAGAILEEPVFKVKSDGQIQMLVPGADEIAGALAIVGSATGEFISPVNTGVMIHITGNLSDPGTPSRVYNDSQNAFGAWVTRRFNGTVASPTAVLANEEIMRLSGTAHNGTTIPGTANQRIVYVARGNQTTSNQGGAIELWATPLNSTTLAKVASVESTGIALESGKVLTGNVTGNLTGDVTGNVSGSAGSVAAANITGTTLAATVVTSSLTSVGTLGSLTVTNLVTAKNYSGQVRNLGTITAGAGTEITIDFATDHMVRFNYSTEPVQVAFTNYSAGKTVTLIASNTNAGNRQLEIGIAAANAQGVSTLDVDGNETAIVTYYCTGNTINDVFASTVYTI